MGILSKKSLIKWRLFNVCHVWCKSTPAGSDICPIKYPEAEEAPYEESAQGRDLWLFDRYIYERKFSPTMWQCDFEAKIASIKKQEEKFGVKITITQLIDKDHLDCTWYGGEVCNIRRNDGWVITIGAYGDIRLAGKVRGNDIYVVDKNNSGRVYDELGNIMDDDLLKELIDKGELIFENNNWFEVDLISPSGSWVDLCGADNVLDDDLLDNLVDIEAYFPYVEWAKTCYR